LTVALLFLCQVKFIVLLSGLAARNLEHWNISAQPTGRLCSSCCDLFNGNCIDESYIYDL